MGKKNLINFLLVASYAAVLFILGCWPTDTLQWSADGSVGIYSKAGALFIVDGNSGSLTQVAAKGTTTRWPGISADGSQFAYGRIVKTDDFNKAINLLPADQVKVIKEHAQILKQKILVEGIKDSNFPFVGRPVATDGGQKDSFNEQHIAWVQRYLVENADAQLVDKIGTELVNKTKSNDLSYCQIVCAPTADPNNQKILATSEMWLWRIRFSPDCRLIAYGAERFNGRPWDVGYDLYVVSRAENTPPVLVAPAAAIGYDFKPDSYAIAYIKPQHEFFDDPVLGSLVERTVVDPNGRLLASFDPNDPSQRYTCTGAAAELVGVLYHPWMHIFYTRENRVFFASAKMSLPASKLDEEEQTIFCCDLLTYAVSDITPKGAPEVWRKYLYLSALSSDSRKILVPGEKNMLALYALGPDFDLSRIIVDANESFGDDAPEKKLVAQWKGQDRFSCLVSEKSHFLTQDPNTPHRRKEIVIIGTDGNLKQVLSKDWPDELLDF
jgi:Tol biopolymer transport system component